MLIRTRMGVSVDGFIATTDGVPVLSSCPTSLPTSHRRSCSEGARHCTPSSRSTRSTGSSSSSFPFSSAPASRSHCPASHSGR